MPIIHPELPRITPAQKSQLIKICNTYKLDYILHYLQTGEINFCDMPELSEERRKILEDKYQAWENAPEPPAPSNPKETSDWDTISGSIALYNNLDVIPYKTQVNLLNLLNKYIQEYSPSNPAGNHLLEAKQYKEELEWLQVDKSNFDAIISYIKTHPTSTHFADADTILWGIIDASKAYADSYIEYMERYLLELLSINQSVLPQSVENHIREAKRIKRECQEWTELKNKAINYSINDDQHSKEDKLIWSVIFDVHNYKNNHTNHLLFNDIKNTFDIIKVRMMDDFESHLTDYRFVSLFLELTKKPVIIPEQEFIDRNIVSKKSAENLRRLKNGEKNIDAVNQENFCSASAEKHTDVFLLGIPSTGKTCLTMGLLGSKLLDWDSKSFGGKYGSQLTLLRKYGKIPGRNIDDFVTSIVGTISDTNNSNISHNINLIDVAGESVAYKCSLDPKASVSFADMGKGLPQLLNNNNDKVFFIVIDPTTRIVTFNRRIEEGDNYDIKTFTVDQEIILHNLCSLLANKKNKAIMKNVKAIHLIATKADLFGNDLEMRSSKIHDIIKSEYQQELTKLQKICSCNDFAINYTTERKLKLYDFSLGQFYLGGIFDYDPTDSDKILNVIRNVTQGKKERSFMDRLKAFFSKPVI